MSEKQKEKVTPENLFNKMDKKIKVTFGLQPFHIERIETEILRWNSIELKSFKPEEMADMKFSKHIWEKLGIELGWCPFTLALYYFEYIEEKAVALARKEGEERMKKMAEAYEIYRFRTIESGNKPDNIVTWIKSYLPEKGDNNGK